MCRHTPTTKLQTLEGIASIGNLNHWRHWVHALEQQIESATETTKYLSDAATYVAWLMLSSELLFSELKWRCFADSALQEINIFDEGYQGLLNAVKSRMTPELIQSVEFVLMTRHILVHKGFPSEHHAPSMRKSHPVDASRWDQVRQQIIDPAQFPSTRQHFDSLWSWFAETNPSVQFGF